HRGAGTTSARLASDPVPAVQSRARRRPGTLHRTGSAGNRSQPVAGRPGVDHHRSPPHGLRASGKHASNIPETPGGQSAGIRRALRLIAPNLALHTPPPQNTTDVSIRLVRAAALARTLAIKEGALPCCYFAT